MKKNFVIGLLVIAAGFGIENAIYFNRQCNKLQKRVVNLAKERNDLQDEVKTLEFRCKNYSEIVDSFDNPHHHDYLLGLQSYQALQISR